MTEKPTPTLSRTEATILNLLISSRKREMYGLELVESSDGKLKRGTIYVTLGRMEEKGFVESRREAVDAAPSAIPRRMYKVTAEGAKALRELAKLGMTAPRRALQPA